jgi:Ca2+-binding EF-hand superfamily protein
MKRFLSAMTVFGVALALSGVVTADEAKAKGKGGKGTKKMNPEALFKKLDANGDGKISPDEFKKLAELGKGGKLKEHPEVLEKIFGRLDTNKDGSLSLEEFKKFGEMRKKKGDGKPGEEDKAETE